MNRITDLYESGSQDLLPVFHDLVQYTIKHFHAEGSLMIKADYPGYREHVKEHDAFLDKVHGFLNDYKQGEERLTYRMMLYIRDWLLSHTQQTDMRYADFLVRTGKLAKMASSEAAAVPKAER
jgi:hemerythrin-like metal-binding protein